MPDYEICSGSNPNKVYPVGRNIRDKDAALYTFNHEEVKIEGVGPFTFDDTAPPADYDLRERTGTRWIKFALYEAKPT